MKRKDINLNVSIGKVKVTQSCPTLCDSMDYTVPGILQARILEWVAVPFSRLVKNIENKLSLLLRQDSRKAKQSKHKIEERD